MGVYRARRTSRQGVGRRLVVEVGCRCGAASGRMSREDAGSLARGDAPPKGLRLHTPIPPVAIDALPKGNSHSNQKKS